MSHLLALPAQQLHLWLIRPDHFTELQRLAPLLTADEQRRVARFHFESDRQMALLTRAALRLILSHYATVEPTTWRFYPVAKGRPEISYPPLPLRFNLSHCHQLLLCGVSSGAAVGVDGEWLGRPLETLSLARRFFAPTEVATLTALPLEQQRSRFFDLWTLKESYIKATGLGLSQSLQSFSVTITTPTATPFSRAIQITDGQQPTTGWHHWLLATARYRVAISLQQPAEAAVDLQLFTLHADGTHQPLTTIAELWS